MPKPAWSASRRRFSVPIPPATSPSSRTRNGSASVLRATRGSRARCTTISIGSPKGRTIFVRSPSSRKHRLRLHRGAKQCGLGSCSLRAQRSEHATLESARGRGFLVLSDQYFPGWFASVNGRSAPIQRANYAFRLVEVPAGQSTVEFWYSPAASGSRRRVRAQPRRRGRDALVVEAPR